MEKKREIWLDVLRAFACMCVVLVHSPAKYDGLIPGQYILAPSNYILMSWGVGLFFALSGALLLSKPVSLSEFYKKRFGRLVAPVIIWSVVYIIYEGWLEDILCWSYFWTKLIMIPFTNQTSLLWFMYTLFGVYLIAPVFANYLYNASRQDCEFLLSIWGITLIIPYIKHLNPGISATLSGNGVLHSFTGFLWYAVFGYYLRKYIDWKVTSWKFITLFLISFGFPLLVNLTEVLPKDVLNTQMSISSVAMTAIPFIFFKNISFERLSSHSVILVFAKYSFGIYLFHFMLLKPLRPMLTQFHLHYAIQIPITACIVGTISMIVVKFLSKLPYSKYLIG